MTAKRAVVGRSMEFDRVMAAYRSSRALLTAQTPQASKGVPSPSISTKVMAAKKAASMKPPVEPFIFIQNKVTHQKPAGVDSPTKLAKRTNESPAPQPHPSVPTPPPAVSQKDTQKLFESILENDFYFEDIAKLSKSLQAIYENSVQLPLVKKTESAFMVPISAKILPSMQDLLSKRYPSAASAGMQQKK